MTPTERIQRLRADLEADLGVTDRELRHAIVVGTLAAPLVIVIVAVILAAAFLPVDWGKLL